MERRPWVSCRRTLKRTCEDLISPRMSGPGMSKIPRSPSVSLLLCVTATHIIYLFCYLVWAPAAWVVAASVSSGIPLCGCLKCWAEDFRRLYPHAWHGWMSGTWRAGCPGSSLLPAGWVGTSRGIFQGQALSARLCLVFVQTEEKRPHTKSRHAEAGSQRPHLNSLLSSHTCSHRVVDEGKDQRLGWNY